MMLQMCLKIAISVMFMVHAGWSLGRPDPFSVPTLHTASTQISWPVLRGMAQAQQGAAALLQIGTALHVVQQGSVVEAYTVQRIGDRHVVISGHGESKALSVG